MSDWRSRAVNKTDPLVASRLAIQERQKELGRVDNTVLPTAPIPDDDLVPDYQPQATSDWRSRAKPRQPQQAVTSNSDWRSRAKPRQQEAQKPAEPGLFERLGSNVVTREKQIQGSAEAYQKGEQTGIETVLQQGLAAGALLPDTLMTTAGYFTPDIVKQGIGDALRTVGELPSFGGGTLNDRIPGELGMIANEASKIAEANPRLARNVQAGADALSIYGGTQAIKGVTQGLNAITSPRNIKEYIKNTSTDPNFRAGNKMTAQGLAKLSGESYDEAAFLGAKFTPQQVSNRITKELDDIAPKPIAGKVLTSEDKTFIDSIKEYAAIADQELSLDDIKRLDETLTAKITSKFIDTRSGLPDANGRKLMMLQRKVRDIVDEADTAGNDALVNARRLWSHKTMLDDLDAVAERASFAADPGKALQIGYKNLYLDKDRIRNWPKEAKELLKKAATPGIGQEALSLLTSRLPAAIGLGTGNVPGAATAQVAGMIARGGREAIVGGRGAKVEQSIIDNAMKGLRRVDIPDVANMPQPPTPGPLLLADPSKMSAAPMTDTQINISRALLRDKGPSVETPSVVRTPTSQVTKLQDTLGRTKGREFNTLVKMFQDGDISQNKFIQDAIKEFKLTTTQARSLAKEIKTYGVKK